MATVPVYCWNKTEYESDTEWCYVTDGHDPPMSPVFSRQTQWGLGVGADFTRLILKIKDPLKCNQD